MVKNLTHVSVIAIFAIMVIAIAGLLILRDAKGESTLKVQTGEHQKIELSRINRTSEESK